MKTIKFDKNNRKRTYATICIHIITIIPTDDSKICDAFINTHIIQYCYYVLFYIRDGGDRMQF